jgi:hypothetical protein
MLSNKINDLRTFAFKSHALTTQVKRLSQIPVAILAREFASSGATTITSAHLEIEKYPALRTFPDYSYIGNTVTLCLVPPWFMP